MKPMTIRPRGVALAVLALLSAAGAYLVAADAGTRAVRGRYALDAAAKAPDWSAPGIRAGSGHAVEALVSQPRLWLSFPAPDSYHVRIFYLLDGEGSAEIRLGEQILARLVPGGWKQADVDLSSLDGQPRVLQLALSEAGRLVVRRVDYRNYLVNAGSAALLKPAGGRRAMSGAVPLAILLAGLAVVCAGAWGISGNKEALTRGCLATLAFGALFLLLHVASPYRAHVRPGALIALFIAAAAGAAVSAMSWNWRVIRVRAAALAVGLLLGVLLVEAALWVWDPPMSRRRLGSYIMHSAEYGWLNRPNVEGWQAGVGYHIRTDRFGHRGPDHPEAKPAGVFRILGLGDSFTFGWGVEERESFLRVMERRLRDAGHNVQVLNAAVPAWHSAQSLHYLRREGRRFRPDLVVMSFFLDDVFFRTIEELRNGPKAQEIEREEVAAVTRTGFRPRLYNFWFNYQQVRRAERDPLGRNAYPTFEAERRDILDTEGHRAFDRNPETLDGLRRMLAEWKKTQEELKIPMLFTYVPPGGSLGVPELQAHPRALERLSREYGFLYLDSVTLLERDPDPRRLYLHPRDGHMSARGHAAIGEGLAKLINEAPRFKR